MCVDYRGLNRITRKNRHPLPRIDELIDRFRGAKYFTKLDLISGYHQQRIYEPHTHKTAFRCRYGHFEFNIVPFGLTNAPASFSNMILKVLDPVLDKWMVVYLDDILIYSKTKAKHLRHIRSVPALLRQHGLYAKLSEGRQFVWDEDTESAFRALKDAISSAPVLRIFDPDLLLIVESDASGYAVGAVLFQIDADGVARPVAFTSCKMNSAERSYPTHEQELLAVVHALKTWRYYLDGSHFIVYTDHAHTSPLSHPAQAYPKTSAVDGTSPRIRLRLQVQTWG